MESDPTDSPAQGQGTGTAPGSVPVSLPVSPPAAGHLATVVEKGSFSTASCGCGWSAPARRSRDKARKDAAQHTAQQAEDQAG
ncbi:hypothetical protein ACEZCY_09455 [Streptacidiphilus sp. N1-12]|uniref:Uncharacterized protein n=2 Tax=Streptacidiphilus alkalitolerans TaxID=3342712 RepID=A0ABV6V727_9ACTN